MVPVTTIRNNMRIKAFPFNSASLAPSNPPIPLQTAMGKAMVYMIFPLAAKKTIDPR